MGSLLRLTCIKPLNNHHAYEREENIPMQQSNIIRFEIRRHLEDAHKYNAMVQAGLDTTDRMANLVGHIPFAELLGQTFDTLVPRILPHVAKCAEYGLIDDPATVTELLSRLQAHNGGDSFETLVARICDDPDAAFPKAAQEVVWQLWFYHGIRLPDISTNRSYMMDVRQGIQEVIDHAGDLSHRTLLELSMTKDMKTSRMALRRAFDRNVISLPPSNGRCCSFSTCVQGNPTDTCYMNSAGVCYTGASYCTNSSYATTSEDEPCGCC